VRMKTWLKALLTIAALSLASLPVIAQQQQQNNSQQQTGDAVADAARKARQKEKTEPKPKKVYTNDDISTSHPDSSTSGKPPAEGAVNGQAIPDNAAAGTPGAAGTEGAAAEEKKDPRKEEEASWRKRFKEIHTKIADAEKELDVLQREGEKAQLQYYSDPQKGLNEQYSRKDVNETNGKIAAKKQEIDQLKQTLSDMEDELRKSGGDPGWASE
jgi:hypothetical protein